MSDFKKLEVWQKAHALMLATHRASATIRRPDSMILRGQMLRAVMSIPTNIVEGRGQRSDKEFARYLRIALNSASELEYHLIAARDLGAILPHVHSALVAQVIEVRKMLHGMLNRIEFDRAKSDK